MCRTLSRLVGSECAARQHVVLRKEIFEKGACVKRDVTLGSVIVTQGRNLGILRVSGCIGNSCLGACQTSNIVLSAPAKSANCDLSTNNPVMSPGTGLFIVAPLTPRSLGGEDIVLPSRSAVSIRLKPNQRIRERRTVICFSKSTGLPLVAKSQIRVSQTILSAMFVGVRGDDFLRILDHGVGSLWSGGRRE